MPSRPRGRPADPYKTPATTTPLRERRLAVAGESETRYEASDRSATGRPWMAAPTRAGGERAAAVSSRPQKLARASMDASEDSCVRRRGGMYLY